MYAMVGYKLSVNNPQRLANIKYLIKKSTLPMRIQIHPRERRPTKSYSNLLKKSEKNVNVPCSEGDTQFHDSQPDEHFKVSFGHHI